MIEMPAQDTVLAQRYASDFAISPKLAELIAQRYPLYDDAKRFLCPRLDQLHDPASLPDIQVATKQILASVKNNEGILIYCHDDVDGYTSAAITYKTLRDLYRSEHCPVYVYPIVREKDGYILNPEVLRMYKNKGVTLLLTVDFGISNSDNFRIAREEGLRLIVCDHHETTITDFPVPAIDPKRNDSCYPFRELAGVGVAFKLAQSLYQTAFSLMPEEFYRLKKEFFPIVLIGTLADRVCQRDENRVFCYHGLKLFPHTTDILTNIFRHDGEIDLRRITSDIIPTLASAAYIDPTLGTGVLIHRDEQFVVDAIATLRTVNGERRRLAESLFNEAIAAAKMYPDVAIAVIPIPKQLYLGSVAARLKERVRRTAIVIGIQNGKCFGELRSYRLNLHKMLDHLRELFLDFGGHQKAAGFSMREEYLDTFIERARTYITEQGDDIADDSGGDPLTPELFLQKSDTAILTPLMPFGEGNPAPRLTDGASMYTVDNKFTIIELNNYGKS
jgi:single-stranded-DNA-specific exonuclease